MIVSKSERKSSIVVADPNAVDLRDTSPRACEAVAVKTVAVTRSQ
ncbi:MAG: hypothetical protein AAF551_00290 [Bacteroidota bacterium]